jgi:hypothetical protein
MIEIGFPFMFDNVYYKAININSNGVLSFDEPLKDTRSNNLNDLSTAALAPFWDVMYVPAAEGRDDCIRPGAIQFSWVGDEPQRILVIDYYDVSLTQGCDSKTGYVPIQFQVRLYEGSNKIEFFYENMDPTSPDCYAGRPTSTSGSIGIAGRNGIISITPNPEDKSGITIETKQDGANVDLQKTGIESGTIYTFCPVTMIGDVKQGGTPDMRDGDLLLEEADLSIFSTQSFQPFTFISPCASTFSYTIEGEYAGDYSIDPTEGKLDPDKGNTPTITFTPSGDGVRSATLIVRDDMGFIARSYELAGEGVARIIYEGNVEQGGTPELEDGDILMTDIKVRNGSSGEFTPITVHVAKSKDPKSPAAPITYTLIDPTGQFSIDRTYEEILPGNSSTPIITFAPNGNVDFQSARLIVNAEGVIREFILRPFASGAGARFMVDGQPYVNGAAVFRNVFGCVGESMSNAVFTVEAIGDEQFVIENLETFQVNSEVVQGNSPAPLLRDPFGETIDVADYFLTDVAGSSTALEFPIVLNPGEVKTLYLTFVPTRPGKRAARTFFQTNGVNILGSDADRQPAPGMVNMEMVGHGMGSALSNEAGKNQSKPVVFATTDVRSSDTAISYIYNNGDCDLRISKDKFRLVSGDVKDFTIVSAFAASSIDPATGDYLIPPGGMDEVVVVFTPIRSGSRRASLRLVTNDSVHFVGGVLSRGEYYVDLFGIGDVGIEAQTLVLPPAVIDGASSSGKALLENTSTDVLEIVKIEIVDGTGEIVEDAAHPWPALPLTLVPGQKMPLWFALVPNGANGVGERAAMAEVTLANGNLLTVDIRGLVGTRTLSAAPTALFQGTKVPVGQVRRAYAMLTNSGTFPIMIGSYQITGPNKDNYAVGTIVRTVIQPGETMPIDVVYTPSAQGGSSAVLEFVTNSTNGTPAGTHIITLGGEGTSTSMGGSDPQSSTQAAPTTGGEMNRVAGAESSNRLHAVAPNPVNGTATFRFSLAAERVAELALYDVKGSLVRTVVSGTQSAGDHVVKADLSTLSAGSYYVRLQVGGQVMTQVITVVK